VGVNITVYTKYNARITAISTEQSVRGIRHGAFRPDLIIADDVEDMASVKTREGRNKTFDWYTSEIIPAGDTYTKRIAVGNLLHEDSLLMRLKERIENNEIDGIYREWPIVKSGTSLWPGKYPDKLAINNLRRNVGNKIAWEREYMLRIIPDEDQVIDARWVQYYDELPEKTEANEFINSFLSVDLAISQSATADYTAIIIIHVFGFKPEDRKYYIDRKFINKKLTHLATLDIIASLYETVNADSKQVPIVLVEQVQYQAAVIEQLKDRGIKSKGIKIQNDKRARLQLASSLFEQGRVYFPKDRVIAPIIQQLVGFGVEKHDDLADSASMGLNYIQTNVKWEIVFGFGFLGGDDDEIHHFYGIKYLDERKG
jgi:predicted phage terminase large subunit-like protein